MIDTHRDRVTGLNLLALGNADLDDDTGHSCSETRNKGQLRSRSLSFERAKNSREPIEPGSEVAFGLEIVSMAALLSSTATARTSAFISKNTSRTPLLASSGPMARSLISSVFPCSIVIGTSSPMWILPRK